MNPVDYNGYEDLGRFTPPQLRAYREMLLEKTQKQVDFIRKHVWPNIKGHCFDVIEIGCGNGRLLVGLELSGMTDSCTGFDTSASRINFARRWADDLGLVEMFPEQTNILNVDASHWDGEFQLAVCITGCFQYFTKIKDARHVLACMRAMSEQHALFELYKRPQMGRTWRKLPDNDPWEYLLDEYVDKGEYVEHTKTFLNNRVLYGGYAMRDERVEHLRYWEMDAFLSLLRDSGFNNVHWAVEDAESMVVLVS